MYKSHMMWNIGVRYSKQTRATSGHAEPNLRLLAGLIRNILDDNP